MKLLNFHSKKIEKINCLLQSQDARQYNEALNFIVNMKGKVLNKVKSNLNNDTAISRYGDDAFIRACHSLFKRAQSKGFELKTPYAFEKYLFTACRGELLKILEKERFMTYLDNNQLPELSTMLDDYRKGEIAATILEEVGDSLERIISAKERRILISKFYWQMSYKEIAKELETTPNSVKTTSCRALQKLKRGFDDNAPLKSYVYGLFGKEMDAA